MTATGNDGAGGLRVGIVRSPGANCDDDTLWAFRSLGTDANYVWHKEEALPPGLDLVVLPGGFTYGDYLRPGCIARFSPVMQAVARFTESGGLVLGICNGFQVLTEAGLLPGALAANRSLKFISRQVFVRVETETGPWTDGLAAGDVLELPIAHHGGAYCAGPELLAELDKNDQVVLRYVAPDGERDDVWNLNGSADAIAGLRNERGNVFGLMPHPERSMDGLLGSGDGRRLLDCLLAGREAAA